jgi:hypothetical protein
MRFRKRWLVKINLHSRTESPACSCREESVNLDGTGNVIPVRSSSSLRGSWSAEVPAVQHSVLSEQPTSQQRVPTSLEDEHPFVALLKSLERSLPENPLGLS